MYRLFFAVALLLSVQTFAVANGGGSSKRTGNLNVVNKDASLVLLVAVDPSASLSAATTASEFTSRGGRIVNAGGSTTFSNLRTGTRRVVFAFVPSSTTSVSESDFSPRNANVVAGRTVTLNLTAPSSSSSN
jgi:hypothetical protein